LIRHEVIMANADFPHQILLFGCGNMGGAMLRGWIASGIDPARFVVVDPYASDLPEGVTHYRSASETAGTFDVVLLGIKPQMLDELAGQISSCLDEKATLISMLAGIETGTLATHFPTAQIIRLMPNLSAAIGKSPLGLWSGDLGTAGQAVLENWLAPLGLPVWLNSESQMNAVTALAGSGPAFVYRFIDALGAAGTALGLEPAIASQLALSMVEGSALLAAQADETPAELAARVTSPGGTTAAGLSELDKGLTALIENTLHAASERGAELANMGKKS
jgi:pyrroline-5-carboxylate reductase